MRFAQSRPGRRGRLLALAVAAAISAAALCPARADITFTPSLEFDFNFDPNTGNYSFLSLGGNVSADVFGNIAVDAINTTGISYWSNVPAWSTTLAAGDTFAATESVFNIVSGVKSLDPIQVVTSSLDLISLGTNLGPTERQPSVSLPLLPSGSSEVYDAITANHLNIGLNFTTPLKYDVTIDSGVNMVMDQSNVIAQSLTIQSGATLTADSSLTVRTTLINLGTLSVESGVSLNLAQPFTNIGIVNLYGGTINAPGPLTNNGTINVAGNSTIGIPFNNTGGTINVAAGTLYVNDGGTSTGGVIGGGSGVLNFGGGTQTLSGNWTGTGGTIGVSNGILAVASGSVVTLANTHLQFTNGTIDGEGTLSVNGGTWSGGAITGAGGLINTGLLAIDDPADNNTALLGGLLTNAGTIIQGANSSVLVHSNGGGTVNNLAGATYDIQGGQIGQGTTNTSFNNAGLLEKSSNAKGDSYLNIPLNNTGTINVVAGTLYVNDGGTSTGGVIGGGSGVLNFGGGTQTLSGNWTGTGGTIGVSNGILAVASGSVVTLANTHLQFTNGTIDGEGTLSVNGGTWSGGAITGAGGLINTGLLAIDDPADNNTALLGGLLTNAGTIIQGANSSVLVRSNGGGTVNNLAGATYDIQGGQIGQGTTNTSFNNAGLLEKSSNAKGDSYLNIPLNNTGTINVVAGTLYVNDGGTSTGGVIGGGSGVLNFGGGTQTLSGNWTGTGGTIGVSNGILAVASGSVVTLANTHLQFTNGTIDGEGTLSVNGGTWSGGAITGAGGLINTGLLAIDDPADNNTALLGGLLTNAGTIIQGANSSVLVHSNGGGTVNNLAGATYDIQGGQIGQGTTNTSFNNAGLLEKSSNAKGDSYLNIPLNNTGTVEVDSGTLNLQGQVTQLQATTLTGGTWNIIGNATLNLPGTIATNQATITLSSSASHFDALIPLANNQGYLSLQNGRSFTTVGDLSNSGQLVIGASSNLTVTGQLTLNGGTLSGYGIVIGNVLAGSAPHTIAPSANLPATSTGNLTLSALSTNNNTTLTFNLISPGHASINDSITIRTANALTLNGGTIQIANTSTGAGSLGYYKIIQYAGSIQGTGLSSLTLPAVTNNIAYTLDTAKDPGYVDLHRGFLGDANDDGIVNFSDFVALSNHFGLSNVGWSGGDFNNDGTVNFSDFVILSNHFGTTISGGNELSSNEIAAFQSETANFELPASVPEPATLPLLALAIVFLFKRKPLPSMP